MMTTVPNNAEAIDPIAVLKQRRRPSVFAPAVEAVRWVMCCPVCGTDHDPPPPVDGQRVVHCTCGLWICWEPTGDKPFRIWRAEAAQ